MEATKGASLGGLSSASASKTTEFTSSGNFTLGASTKVLRVLLIGAGGGGGGAARSTYATGAGGVGGAGWALVVEY